MTDALKALLAREGRLSYELIQADPSLPAFSCVTRRLGPIRRLYTRIGIDYRPRRMSRRRGPDGRLLPRDASATLPSTEVGHEPG